MSVTPDKAFRICAVIPTYNNPLTIRGVVRAISDHVDEVFVVDDAGDAEAAEACASLRRDGLATVIRRERNGGKGAAVLTGLRAAQRAGYTHALQVDGDGQHELERAPVFVDKARCRPEALILGYPEYDETVPALRLNARRITDFWVNLEIGSDAEVRDAMIGFRVYPLAATLGVSVWTRRMGFDIEVIVKLVWSGVPVVNVPVRVRYLSEEEGGVSHFRPVGDNVAFSFMHARLTTSRFFRSLFRLLTGRNKALPPSDGANA